jgi:hypothetical protein
LPKSRLRRHAAIWPPLAATTISDAPRNSQKNNCRIAAFAGDDT